MTGEAPAGRRPRVVLTSRIFLPEAAAASLRLWSLARGLARHGAEVTVLTVRPAAAAAAGSAGSAEAELRADHVRISRWPVHRDRSGIVRGYLQYLSFDVPLALRLLLVRRPDVVVTEPPPTTGAVVRVVAALRRVPYVYYAADIWSDASASTDAPRVLVAAVARLERWALRGARSVLAVSEGVGVRLREMGVAADRITVVAHGIDTEVFTPQGPAHVEPDGAPYLLYAGTASEWHGAEIFVRALALVRAQVPDVRVVFLGQGSDWPAMRVAADALGLGVGRLEALAFLEAAPPAEAAAWFRGSVAALASLRPGVGYDFAVPTKALAAVACGTPVVYVGPGPARALVREADLGSTSDYDVAEVAAAMLDRLGRGAPDEAERERLGRWAQANASAARAGTQAAEVVRRTARGLAAPATNPTASPAPGPTTQPGPPTDRTA